MKQFFALAVSLAVSASENHALVSAQTFTTLHNFTAVSSGTNVDGAHPVTELTVLGNALYGTGYSAGVARGGTFFKINTDGSGFTNLYNFTAADGNNPHGGLILSGGTFYGTLLDAGAYNEGAVFSIQPDGTGIKNLHSFSGADGSEPSCSLLLMNNAFYGTTESGGIYSAGTVFRMNTDGSGITNLHVFTGGDDGNYPYASLIAAGNRLYGTTAFGGMGNGTVFSLNPDGTGFTTLYEFNNVVGDTNGTNGDGAFPTAGLLLSSNVLYGVADGGGLYGQGTIYRVNTNGSGFTNLYNFPGGNGGANPLARLIQSGTILYGTTSSGGAFSNGAVFQINLDGSGFKNLHSFSALPNPAAGTNADGRSPNASLVLAGNTLFGTTYFGGTGASGTLFAVTLPAATPGPIPQITMQGGQLVLIWPATATNYVLQTTMKLPTTNWINVTNISPGGILNLPKSTVPTFFQLYPK